MRVICDRCYGLTTEGEHGLYKCPLEARRRAPVIWADDIPGGIDIAHGLCNDDGTPKRYYSRSEMKLAAQVKGLIPWGDVYEESRTKDARVRDEWLQSGEAQKARRDRAEARAEKQLARERAAQR